MYTGSKRDTDKKWKALCCTNSRCSGFSTTRKINETTEQFHPIWVLAECVVLELNYCQFSRLSKQRLELNTKWYVRVYVVFFINWTFSKAIENMCIVIPELLFILCSFGCNHNSCAADTKYGSHLVVFCCTIFQYKNRIDLLMICLCIRCISWLACHCKFIENVHIGFFHVMLLCWFSWICSMKKTCYLVYV